MAGRRRGGGRRLGVHGAAVSSIGGRCGDGGARRWPKVALDGIAASANEGRGRLCASMGPSGGQCTTTKTVFSIGWQRISGIG
jgi:hypothetical protein